MHLLIPFASDTAEAASQVLGDLTLPNLARLLARLTPTHRDAGEPDTFSPPHERALAAAYGWHGADGRLPFAADAARRDGVAVGERAWGLLTPAHWLLGRDHVSLIDPAALDLAEAESRALFEAVRPLFESEGWSLEWGAAQRWYLAHDSLADLACASLDRVIGRNVEAWLAGERSHAPSRLIRRLQSEVQMLLYPHPVNEAREARGALTMNSFWLSGCGRPQPIVVSVDADADADADAVTIVTTLRTPLLARDWAAWAEAWCALDGGPLAALRARVEAGAAATLTLCGERVAQRYATAPRSLWQRAAQRWSAPAPSHVLEAL